MNPRRPAGDRREDDLRRRNRKILSVVLPETDEGQSELIGEHRLLDDISEHRGLWPRVPRLVVRHVAESIEPEFDLVHPAIIAARSTRASIARSPDVRSCCRYRTSASAAVLLHPA